jgi:hypothetical protein
VPTQRARQREDLSMKIRNLLFKPELHDEARALLDRYHCPVPFHAVRTRFLGQSLSLSASPLDAVRSLWGGVLPEFEDRDARNELMRTLMVGLWDELARHRDKGSPFQLVHMAIPSTTKGRVEIAVVRGEELDGFAEGVSGARESLPLPRRPQIALKVHSFLRLLFAHLHRLASDPAKLTMGGRRRDLRSGPRNDENGRTYDLRVCARCRALATTAAEHGADREATPALIVVRLGRARPTALPTGFSSQHG